MKKSSKRALIVAGILVGGLVAVAFALRLSSRPAEGSVLEMVLDDVVPERAVSSGLGPFFGGRKLSMRDYVEALRLARDDRRVNGLLVRIDGPELGAARLQELRDAILDFQKGGKKWAVAYLETAGEFSSGNRDYYLATACGSIWLSPPGDVNLIGLRLETPFVRGTLDLLGIIPDFDHIGKYKSAMNTFTDKAMNDPNREALDAVAGSIFGQIKRDIAAGRHLSEEQVGDLIDHGPYVGPKALAAKLVDAVGYRDDVEAHLKEKNGGALPLIRVGKYLKAGRYYSRGPRIALVYGLGEVHRGEGESNPLTGESSMGSETLAAAIRTAREDATIRAIVFRVDSPGGSYIASDVIHHEIELTRKVKPVIVSMGDLAGSGGYFVAMGSNWIVAEPATITASIGVLAGKMVTTGFWSKVGITFDAVQRGKNATFFSTGSKYTPEEREIFEGWLQRIYKDFVEKAAAGRHKTFDEIHAVAQGRIWSGEDALRLGLVDELGGLSTAIRRAQELAHLDPKRSVQLVVLPEERGLFRHVFEDDSDTATPFTSLQRQLRRLVEEGPAPGPDGVLSMPFVPVLR